MSGTVIAVGSSKGTASGSTISAAMVAVGDADALDVGCAESTPFEDAESVADGDADAVAVAVAVDDAEADELADELGDALALPDTEADALSEELAEFDALAEAEALAVGSETLAAAGISQSLSRIAPPAGQFFPAKPANGGMMSPQPGVG